MHYSKAISIINSLRRRNELEAEAKYRQALDMPEFYAVECKLRSLQLKSVDDKSKAANDSLLRAKKKRDSVLTKLGISESDFAPQYDCTVCDDTGIYNGIPCKCVRNLIVELSMSNTSAILSNASFATADFGIFARADIPKIERLYALMMSFCRKFPRTKYRNILLLGSTGTGKTHLVSCIANYLIPKGENVLAVTSFELVNRAHKYHTTFDETRHQYLDPLLDSDLLIVDDLGTEPILKNITLEYLYLIINERLVKGKHTIVTSNLDPSAIGIRYGKRISSRLLDKSSTYAAELVGKDIRKII